jgi:hypothetical protein
MATYQEFHVNGTASIWASIGSGNSANLVGYSQDGVTIELHYETEDIMTDKWGSKIPEDVMNLGQWATVKCNLIKYDTLMVEYLNSRLAETGVVGDMPNNITGSTDCAAPNAIGRLMGQCGSFTKLWVQRCNPACETVVEGGWKFDTAYLADIDSFKVGTRVTIHDLTFRCLPNASGVLYTLIGTATPTT